VSNFACAPFLDENSALNEQECAKVLDYSSIANERSRLLSDDLRYGDLLAKLEKTADTASKYLRITASLSTVNDRQVIDFHPTCFKNVSSWLPGIATKNSFEYDATFPARSMRKGVDSNGRAVTQEGDNNSSKYYFGFSPKRLSKEKLSDVFLDTDATEQVRVSALRACQ
jgi:hypothetical protein